MASNELLAASGYPSEYDLTIEFNGGLTETADELAPLKNLRGDELREIEDLTVYVQPSRSAYRKAVNDHIEGGGTAEGAPSAPEDQVRFAGLEIERTQR